MDQKQDKTLLDREEIVIFIERLDFFVTREGFTRRSELTQVLQERIEISPLDIYDPVDSEHG